MDAEFHELVKASEKNLRLEPNMGDYDKVYKKFKWDDVKNEVVWFEGGKVNIAYNAIDRHRDTWRRNKVALYWEGEDGRAEKYTFLELSELSSKFANVLKKYGLKRGDRAFIFLPRVPQTYITFLGIVKAGGVAGTLFAAFGPDALKDRLQNSEATFLITNENLRDRVEKVRSELPALKNVIIVGGKNLKEGEISYEDEMAKASRNFEAEKMDPKELAFMLYTSGSTGKPKGVMHVHGGRALKTLGLWRDKPAATTR